MDHRAIFGNVQKGDFAFVLPFIFGVQVFDLEPRRGIVPVENQGAALHQFSLGFGEIGDGTVDVNPTVFLVPLDGMEIATFVLIDDARKVDGSACFRLDLLSDGTCKATGYFRMKYECPFRTRDLSAVYPSSDKTFKNLFTLKACCVVTINDALSRAEWTSTERLILLRKIACR